jgi:hypothetical protein
MCNNFYVLDFAILFFDSRLIIVPSMPIILFAI